MWPNYHTAEGDADMIRQHPRIKTAVALSAIAAALVVAGCGSSSSDKAGGTTVRAAYGSSTVPGYQIEIKVTGTAGGHPVNVTGTGAFDQAAHAGRLTMNVRPPSPGAQSLQINAVMLGKDFYLRLPASLSSTIPGGKTWLEFSLSEIGKRAGIQGLSSLGESPAQFIHSLRAASTGGVQSLGRQTIDGVSTSVSRATVDLSKVAGTLPASEQQSAFSAITAIEKLTGLHYIPIEAWVDSSDHVRRIVLSENGHVEGQPFAETVQVDFVKYGLEPVPAAPPADEVTNVLSLLGTR
jgi:hypothetical protein